MWGARSTHDVPPLTPAGLERPRLILPRLTLLAWCVGVGLVVTAMALWVPYPDYNSRSLTVEVFLDTVDGCVAILAAFLVHGRFVRGHRLQDRLLAYGLVLLALASFALPYTAIASAEQVMGDSEVWLPLTVRVLAALLIAASAVVGDRMLVGRGTRQWSPVAPLALMAVVVGVLATAGLRLPPALGEQTFSGAGPVIFGGQPLLVTGQVVLAGCFFVASVLYTSQSARHGDDDFLRWLGGAFMLGGFARVHYALFPALHVEWLYTGDLLRLCFYMMLLMGAARELSQYFSAQSQEAVLMDRRRLARELHDGVVQELAYIRLQSHRIPATTSARQNIIRASDRALDEARAAVQALDVHGQETLSSVLHATVRELAHRHTVQLEANVDDTVYAESDQRHALARITREAVTNAVCHGNPERICVELRWEGPQRRLVIRDDGRGFDMAAALSTDAGYGLIGMRQRAEALPGSLDLWTEIGEGSVVTVTW